MNVFAFDTHVFIKDLIAVGMSEAQAEVLAKHQTKLIEERLATKHDLKEMEARLTARIGGMILVAVALLKALDTFI